jgi:CRP-like cAMP-binding protein
MPTNLRQTQSYGLRLAQSVSSASDQRQRTDKPLQAAIQRSIDIYSLLRSVPILQQLAVEPLIALAERMEIQLFGRGQKIFHQGDPGDALYLIARGQVRVSYPSTLGRELTVAIFGTTDFFGELALLDDGPRLASAMAMCPTITLLLEREAFRQLLRDQPVLTEALLAELATRLRLSTTAAELFAHHSAPQECRTSNALRAGKV